MEEVVVEERSQLHAPDDSVSPPLSGSLSAAEPVRGHGS